jgi:hypothetical protein
VSVAALLVTLAALAALTTALYWSPLSAAPSAVRASDEDVAPLTLANAPTPGDALAARSEPVELPARATNRPPPNPIARHADDVLYGSVRCVHVSPSVLVSVVDGEPLETATNAPSP